MINQHKNIENLLKNKIQELKKDKNNVDTEEIERLKKLYSLVTNKYMPFFSKVDISVALNVLTDIGIPQEELMSTYENLMKEELNKRYTLIDINRDEEEK